MTLDLMSIELTDEVFETVSRRIHNLCGITLVDSKKPLVRARLTKRLRALGLTRFEDYLDAVEADTSGSELVNMIDVLTTNKTSFFRESQHFDLLRDRIVPQYLMSGGPLRIWSAGCSTGEEPYTIAMVLCEAIPDVERRDVKVLATDISTQVLDHARAGVYASETLKQVPEGLCDKYFKKAPGGPAGSYRVVDKPRRLVQFARLNLLETWPMKGPLDVIFCRNVMIYFDRETRQNLVARYWRLLRPGGHLLVGHSESLTSSSHQFRYVQPAVYVK